MNPIGSCVATLAVAVIFYIYRAYTHLQERRKRVLRKRVAYMLWVMADRADHNKTMAVN